VTVPSGTPEPTGVPEPTGIPGLTGIPGAAGAPCDLPRLLRPAPVPAERAPVPAGHAPGWLIAEVEQAGLTGRGGAGFPAGRKMRAVAAAVASQRPGRLRAARGAVVVANGVESEPASGKDAALLAQSPHLVLDGIELAAEAVGATVAYLCLGAGQDLLAGALRDAVAERDQASHGQASRSRVPIQVTTVPGGYLASQETALVSFLSGGPQRPAFVPPRPADRGVRGRPTLVQNAETLAHIALIARHGAAWFRRLGTPTEAGSVLITVTGAVRQPGVLEIGLGTPAGTVLDLAGGPTEPVQAVLAGGYLGGWLAAPAAWPIPVSHAALRNAGAALGPGTLTVLPESACGLAETARVLAYLASQRAGQCGPCSHGLPALAAAFGQIAFDRPHPDTIAWADQLLTLVTGRGACHLPDGGAALAASALRVFARDLHRHASFGPCPQASRAPVVPVPGPALAPGDGRPR
jgi:NADH:ubiquinone oxidoreductase subunit F (NADH-binding)